MVFRENHRLDERSDEVIILYSYYLFEQLHSDRMIACVFSVVEADCSYNRNTVLSPSQLESKAMKVFTQIYEE